MGEIGINCKYGSTGREPANKLAYISELSGSPQRFRSSGSDSSIRLATRTAARLKLAPRPAPFLSTLCPLSASALFTFAESGLLEVNYTCFFPYKMPLSIILFSAPPHAIWSITGRSTFWPRRCCAGKELSGSRHPRLHFNYMTVSLELARESCSSCMTLTAGEGKVAASSRRRDQRD